VRIAAIILGVVFIHQAVTASGFGYSVTHPDWLLLVIGVALLLRGLYPRAKPLPDGPSQPPQGTTPRVCRTRSERR